MPRQPARHQRGRPRRRGRGHAASSRGVRWRR